MATTIFSSWLLGHRDLLPTPGIADTPLPDIGMTLFVRAPQLVEDETSTGWAMAAELSDLIESPHWQPPGQFVDGNLVLSEVAGLASYYVSVAPPRNVVRLPDGFSLDSTGAPTSIPLVAMAFWFNGTLGSKYRPLISLVGLDEPLLLMANEDNNSTLVSSLFMAWDI